MVECQLDELDTVDQPQIRPATLERTRL